MKLLLDTNVLIDYFARREPYVKSWVSLRAMEAFGVVELWVSAKSYTDIFYVTQKAVSSAHLQQAFLKGLDFLKPCSISASDLKKASQACWDDFEDCIIDIAAQKVKADFIITRDKEGFSQSTIPAKTIEELLLWLQEEEGLSFSEAAL